MISRTLRNRARELRKSSTPFEQTFWSSVRGNKLMGYAFRRQQVIGHYIVDFVCLEKRLVIELDGSHHANQRTYDLARDTWLSSEGYRVLRVWNREWAENAEGVLQKIIALLTESPTPTPPPATGEGL